MANIKELKKRIKSTKSTLKITSAMKLVSAAKLAKAQGRITSFRPYSNELLATAKKASQTASGFKHSFLKSINEEAPIALMCISSERGLCGSYNSQVYKSLKKFLQSSNKKVELYFFGKKVKELAQREFPEQIIESFSYKKLEPQYSDAIACSEFFSKLYLEGKVSEFHIISNKFISAIDFETLDEKVLPFELPKDVDLEESQEFIFEPDAVSLLNELIPEVYVSAIYSKMLDAIASEHGSRMSAMDSASKNCKEMIKSLTLKMNKLRQAAITTELSEIVSGAESLNS